MSKCDICRAENCLKIRMARSNRYLFGEPEDGPLVVCGQACLAVLNKTTERLVIGKIEFARSSQESGFLDWQTFSSVYVKGDVRIEQQLTFSDDEGWANPERLRESWEAYVGTDNNVLQLDELIAGGNSAQEAYDGLLLIASRVEDWLSKVRISA